MNNKKDYFLPFILTLIVIGADQISKILVVKYMLPYEIAYSLFGDFLNLRLVYNTGAAFSFGAGLNQIPRLIVLGALPLVALVALLFVYFKKDYFTKAQRWFICGIIGGIFIFADIREKTVFHFFDHRIDDGFAIPEVFSRT